MKTSFDKLKILSLNANNINKKKIELQALLNILKPHIALIQETHCKEDNKNCKIEGYNITETDMKGKPGVKGMAIIVRRDIIQNTQNKSETTF
ncbi:hypothetical protein NUSPORA_01419 [Nucleospora cyclopteri]